MLEAMGQEGSSDSEQRLRVPGFASWLDGGDVHQVGEWAQLCPRDPQFPNEFLAQRSGVFNTCVKPFQERQWVNC